MQRFVKLFAPNICSRQDNLLIASDKKLARQKKSSLHHPRIHPRAISLLLFWCTQLVKISCETPNPVAERAGGMGVLQGDCCGRDGSPAGRLLWEGWESCRVTAVGGMGVLQGDCYGRDGSPAGRLLWEGWESCRATAVGGMGVLQGDCCGRDGSSARSWLQEGWEGPGGSPSQSPLDAAVVQCLFSRRNALVIGKKVCFKPANPEMETCPLRHLGRSLERFWQRIPFAAQAPSAAPVTCTAVIREEMSTTKRISHVGGGRAALRLEMERVFNTKHQALSKRPSLQQISVRRGSVSSQTSRVDDSDFVKPSREQQNRIKLLEAGRPGRWGVNAPLPVTDARLS